MKSFLTILAAFALQSQSVFACDTTPPVYQIFQSETYRLLVNKVEKDLNAECEVELDEEMLPAIEINFTPYDLTERMNGVVKRKFTSEVHCRVLNGNFVNAKLIGSARFTFTYEENSEDEAQPCDGVRYITASKYKMIMDY